MGLQHLASQFCDDPNAVFTPGERVGRFIIARQLGAGAFGEVFLAFDTELRRNVALKFLHHQRIWPTEITRRFRSEARALAKLRHPHVVAVHDMGASSQSEAELLTWSWSTSTAAR